MGAGRSKVARAPEATLLAHDTRCSEAVKRIFGRIQAPPRRENPTMQTLKTHRRVGEEATADRRPTMEEIEHTEKGLQYRKDRLHFGICGSAGSGKSSLVNAFRGLKAGNPGSAPIEDAQPTASTTRYPDTRSGMPYELFVWYEIPYPGTSNTSGSQYFTERGFYAFDFVILVYDTRITEMDAKILEDCHEFDVPVFIVRSKASQRIQNMCENDDLEYPVARDQYIKETRDKLEDYLTAHELDSTTRCYIVSNHRLHSLIKSVEATVGRACSAAWRRTEKDIDEEQLLVDAFKTVIDRRYKQPLSYHLISKRSTRALVMQISRLTGIEGAKLFAAIEAIMRIQSKFCDPSRIIQAIGHYIKENPGHTAFRIICIILIANPVFLLGFGSGGVIGGSIAAVWQATMGGYIAAGSLFAILQSIGATCAVLIPMLGVGGLAMSLSHRRIERLFKGWCSPMAANLGEKMKKWFRGWWKGK